MKNHSLAELLALSVIIVSVSRYSVFANHARELKGELYSTLTFKGEEESKVGTFSVKTTGVTWKIITKEHDKPYGSLESSYDGTNYYHLVLDVRGIPMPRSGSKLPRPGEKPTQKPANDCVGTIARGSWPLPGFDQFHLLLWWGVVSQSFDSSVNYWVSNAPPFYADLASANDLFVAGWKPEIHFEIDETERKLIQFFDDGNTRFWPNPSVSSLSNFQTRPRPSPLNTRWCVCSVEILQRPGLQQMSAKFSGAVLNPNSGNAEISTTYVLRCVTTSSTPLVDEAISPSFGKIGLITDLRFAKDSQPLRALNYFATNEWLTEEKVRSLPAYTAALTSQNQDVQLDVKEATYNRASALRGITIFSTVLLALGSIIVISYVRGSRSNAKPAN